ncbi:MAG: IS110 family transposase [Velocimicrobium sp.]
MRRKEEYVYVGVDLHKVTHTAVLLDCWNEKLDEITFNNIPSEFIKLEKMVNKYCKKLSKEKGIAIEPVYGLEDAYGYGRSLALYLLERKFIVKDVNPSLSNLYRRSAPTTKKNDSYDAQGVATILINMLDTLPNAKPLDDYWTLAQLVNRRDNIVTDNTRVKNQLNEQLFHAYPSYRKFFTVLDRPTALYFWGTYPSPQHLQGVTVEQLAGELRPISHNQCSRKRAQLILDLVEKDGETIREFQNERDFITRNLVRSLAYQNGELTAIEREIEKMMVHFDSKLTSISGVSTVMAAKLLAEIGDINRFTSADRLASYAGIAPIRFSSAGKGNDQISKQGNRTLHGVFYFLAVQMVETSRGSGIPRNPIFFEYFHRKIAEGKTKPQALICIMRRLVNIIYGMLKNHTEYRLPELPKEQAM